jgi:hypothetical protein
MCLFLEVIDANLKAVTSLAAALAPLPAFEKQGTSFASPLTSAYSYRSWGNIGRIPLLLSSSSSF